MGLATHLQLPDLAALQLQGWLDEALATAQIEGEILQLNSVRASAARRLGLSHDKKVKRDARAEATLNLLQGALQSSHQANLATTSCMTGKPLCFQRVAVAHKKFSRALIARTLNRCKS